MTRAVSAPPPYRFPGMDPWLESPGFWAPFHGRLLIYMADDLTTQVRPRYIAVPGTRLVVEEPMRSIVPDVTVLEAHADRSRPRTGTAVAVEEPLVVQIESEPSRQHFIEIREPGAGGRVVTVIEALFPANKEAGADGRGKYLAKQAEVLASEVNLVEIDLLRAGHHTVAVPFGLFPPTHYRIVIRRATDRKLAEIYPVALQQRLPRIRIPLKPGDADAVADLQALVEKVYREGSLGDLLNYSVPPQPPLEEPDALWAREVLAVAQR